MFGKSRLEQLPFIVTDIVAFSRLIDAPTEGWRERQVAPCWSGYQPRRSGN